MITRATCTIRTHDLKDPLDPGAFIAAQKRRGQKPRLLICTQPRKPASRGSPMTGCEGSNPRLTADLLPFYPSPLLRISPSVTRLSA